MSDQAGDLLPIDTSDVDRWIGKPVGGPQLKEAVTAGDIRAWVQAMHNPNPLHYDDEFAARSIFGRLVAPQSFTLACEQQHGVIAAHAGKIPGSHILWGGSEWFFHGPRIFPDDRIRCERVPYDYRITNTGFAGPTMFQRGDTLFYNQADELIARCRTTAVRYLLENARRLKKATEGAPEAGEPDWTPEQLEAVHEEKHVYHRSFRERAPRKPGDIYVGEKLVRGVLGPHSIASLATEWRAYLWSRGWGGNTADKSHDDDDAGFSLGSGDAYRRRGALDPEQTDIIYYGQARGHLDPKYAKVIGMPRPYGFGASMSSWVLDYVANWGGPYGLIVRSKYEARGPALSGDVTYLDATVTDVKTGERPGTVIATLDVRMTSHPAGKTLGKATAEVEFDADRNPRANK
jgi:acyl dehydratase